MIMIDRARILEEKMEYDQGAVLLKGYPTSHQAELENSSLGSHNTIGSFLSYM
jgi:hypothetical protein